ncbi:MAG TPA: hypothetical protein VLH85_02235 [Levilinea sp.]|nr:hypothetical protein [Levilinea sp.]
MDHPLNDLVECHSGHEYADRPVALYYDGERFEITEIIDRWRIPDGRCFRVLTSSKCAFELFYDELFDEWRVNPI